MYVHNNGMYVQYMYDDRSKIHSKALSKKMQMFGQVLQNGYYSCTCTVRMYNIVEYFFKLCCWLNSCVVIFCSTSLVNVLHMYLPYRQIFGAMYMYAFKLPKVCHVLYKHSNDEQASPANLRSTIGSMLMGSVSINNT